MGRKFTAASSERIQVAAAGVGGLNFTWGTFAACLQLTTATAFQTIFSMNAGGAIEWEINASGVPDIFVGSPSTAITAVPTGVPVVIAATKATGFVGTFFHLYRFDTNVWVHEGGSASLPDAAATTAVTIGSESDAASQQPLNAEVFALAVWPQQVLSDLEITRLSSGEWARWNPGFLEQCDWGHDQGDMLHTMGRYRTKQTGRTGTTRGTLKAPGGFRMSPARHRG